MRTINNFNHGAVFGVQLKNGLYGIFVLRSPPYFRPLLYAYRWFKNYIPDLERVKRLKPLILTNEIAPKMYRKRVLSITPEGIVPESFNYLGDIPFTKYPETEVRCLKNFDYLEEQTYLEWLLEFDKATWQIVLDEENSKKSAVPVVTYSQVLNEDYFINWQGFIPDTLLQQCKQLIKQLIIDLNEVKNKKRASLSLVKDFIYDIGKLNKNDNFLYTPEIEDISEALYSIADFFNLDDEAVDNIIENQMDW